MSPSAKLAGFVSVGALGALLALSSGCGTVGGYGYTEVYGGYGYAGPWDYGRWEPGGYVVGRPPYHRFDEHHDDGRAPGRAIPSIPNRPRPQSGNRGGDHHR